MIKELKGEIVMTVKELIELLECLDEENEVRVCYETDDILEDSSMIKNVYKISNIKNKERHIIKIDTIIEQPSYFFI